MHETTAQLLTSFSKKYKFSFCDCYCIQSVYPFKQSSLILTDTGDCPNHTVFISMHVSDAWLFKTLEHFQYLYQDDFMQFVYHACQNHGVNFLSLYSENPQYLGLIFQPCYLTLRSFVKFSNPILATSALWPVKISMSQFTGHWDKKILQTF